MSSMTENRWEKLTTNIQEMAKSPSLELVSHNTIHILDLEKLEV